MRGYLELLLTAAGLLTYSVPARADFIATADLNAAPQTKSSTSTPTGAFSLDHMAAPSFSDLIADIEHGDTYVNVESAIPEPAGAPEPGTAGILATSLSLVAFGAFRRRSPR